MKLRLKFRLLVPLDMSAQAFKDGFCAYEESIKIPCANAYEMNYALLQFLCEGNLWSVFSYVLQYGVKPLW